MDSLTILIGVTVFAAVTLLILSLRGGRPQAPRLEDRLHAYRSEPVREPEEAEDEPTLRRRTYSGLPVLSAFLAQFKGSEKVAIQLEQAGLPLRVGEFYMIRYVTAALLFIVPLIFARTPVALVLAVGLAAVGYLLPPIWVASKKKSRIAKIEHQLVEMLGMVSNSLKSGYGLMQSFEFASRQMPPPLALELRRMLRDSNLGLGAEEALVALGRRLNSADLDLVLTAISVQRTVGGNLAEILDNVAFTMRERERIRGEIKTLTSQQRMTAIVIGGLPVFVGLLFMVINPDYMMLLFTEMAGRAILGAAVLLEVLGFFVMNRVMAIEV
jgi:tight adherence protein B